MQPHWQAEARLAGSNPMTPGPVRAVVAAVCCAAVLVLAGCSSHAAKPGAVNTPSSSSAPTAAFRLVEPNAGATPSNGCEESAGVSRLNLLFAAINRQDLDFVSGLFPPDGLWDFTLRGPPGMLNYQGREIVATSRTSISAIMSEFTGFHVAFRTEPTGARYSDGSENVGMSVDWVVQRVGTDGAPIFWSTGKATIDCTTGYFKRVLLRRAMGTL